MRSTPASQVIGKSLGASRRLRVYICLNDRMFRAKCAKIEEQEEEKILIRRTQRLK